MIRYKSIIETTKKKEAPIKPKEQKEAKVDSTLKKYKPAIK